MIEQGIRRYGFHGLSYRYIARRLPDFAPGASRVVVAHLGSGASMCAIRDGEVSKERSASAGSTACPWVPGPDRSIRGCCCTGCRRSTWTRSRSNDLYKDLACSASPEFPTICGTCWRAIRTRWKPSNCSATTSPSNRDAGSHPRRTRRAGIHRRHRRARRPGPGRVCRRAEWLGIHLDEAANAAGGRVHYRSKSGFGIGDPDRRKKMIAIHTRNVLASGERAL